MVWGSMLAWYLFLAGLAAGAYATSAIANLKSPDSTKKLQLVGRLIAPIAIIVGLLLLIIDARAGFQNPARFFYLLTNWNSVMTWGTAILVVFTLFAVVSLILALLKKPIPKAFDWIGIIAAICTAVYTGVLIGVVQTYPLWNSSVLPVLFAVSAFSAGLAGTLLISTLFAHKEIENLGMLKRYHFVLPIVEVVLIAGLLYMTTKRGTGSGDSVSLLLSGNLAPMFWGGLIAAGILVPIIIGVFSLIMSNRSKNSEAAGASGGVLALDAIGDIGILIGGFLLRYLILAAAIPLVFIL
ncbi:MAG: polysulfide reductase NrfD [Coriobacteriia bacterium]|nr:polysulfide reductase NrfD [Coriobacteriia bacterium]